MTGDQPITDLDIEKGTIELKPAPRCKTCRTCRWWSQWPQARGVGECECSKLMEIRDPHFSALPTGSQLLARAADDPLILTGPDFGCIHWEAKDNG